MVSQIEQKVFSCEHDVSKPLFKLYMRVHRTSFFSSHRHQKRLSLNGLSLSLHVCAKILQYILAHKMFKYPTSKTQFF